MDDILLRYDLSAPLQGAESRGGRWETRQGHLEQQELRPGRPSLLVMGEPDWNDYTARVQVRMPAPEKGTEAGLAVQFRDPNDYVVFSLASKKGGMFAVLRIEVAAGMQFPVNADYLQSMRVTTMVGDQSALDGVDPTDWHELRLDVHGTAFNGFVDGRRAAEYDFSRTQPSWYVHAPLWAADPDRGRMGLISVGWPAEFRNLEVRKLADFSSIVTPQSGRRDAEGRLLARQSYSDTMRRFTEWIMHCDSVVEKDVAPPALRNLEPYVLAIDTMSGNEALNFDIGEFAFNAGTFISGAVQYYLYTGNRAILGHAGKIADWGIANSTPADWAAPHLPPSIVRWQPDGSWTGLRSYDTWGLELDKASYLGEAYLRLYAVTGKKQYLQASQRIADTLLKLRLPDGHWPFRIDPRTATVNYDYTHSQLWYVRFFERLASLSGEARWLTYRDGALQWLLDNPVKTNRWIGLYGDFASGSDSYDQWVPLELAQYLLDHRQHRPEYVGIARGIVDWVEKTLVVRPGLHEGVPGVLEQSGYGVVLTHHALRLGQTYAVLWGATRDPGYRQLALDVANSVTWLLMSDGKMRFAFWYHAHGIHMRCNIFNEQWTRIMAEIPETAPREEDHLLHTSTDVRRITYGTRGVRYATFGPGTESFVLRREPREVLDGDLSLKQRNGPGELPGWEYDPANHFLRVRHRKPAVQIVT